MIPFLCDLFPTLRMLVQQLGQWLAPWLWRMMLLVGGSAVILIALACTRVPFDLHRWLGSGAGECSGHTSTVVVLGGSGMPSGPELLRLHRTAEWARQYPHAAVVVIHPDTADAMRQMLDELVLRGVGRERITTISKGENTREQALVFARSGAWKNGPITLVTAPENMMRSVLAFRKTGLPEVCGVPAWDHAMHHDFSYGHSAIGGKAWVPDVSGNTGLRYTFWNYLKLEITCLRELTALAYYRMNGWC